MKYSSMHNRSGRVLALLGACAVVALGMAPNAAWAADCRTIATVTHSANLANNTADGGHVDKHVVGQPVPAGSTQGVGTTAYDNITSYNAVWGAYLADTTSPVPNCLSTGSDKIDPNVPVANLGLPLPLAISTCTTTSPNGCTAWGAATATSAQFVFKRLGGDWILLTAFPRP